MGAAAAAARKTSSASKALAVLREHIGATTCARERQSSLDHNELSRGF